MRDSNPPGAPFPDPPDPPASPDPWYQRDDLWQNFASMLFSPARWESAAEQVGQMITLLAPEPCDAVLDLCCGPGRHSLEFARRRFRVTGVDRTAAYLAEARERAAAESLEVEWILSDMRRFSRPDAFDVAISAWTSFGYFDDPADDLLVLSNLHDSLKPGGRLLIDVNGKEIIAREFQNRRWWEEGSDLILEESLVAPDWSRITSRWIKFTGTQRAEFRFTVRPYSAVELMSAARSAGFSSIRVFGGLDRIPYDQNARRLIAVATK